MKPKPLPPVEAASLELATIVQRERELLTELAALKIQKSKAIVMIRELVTGAPPEPDPSDSKKEVVQRVVFNMELGSEITTSSVAALVDINPTMVSNYLSAMVKEGYLKRLGRGKFVVERTVM